MPTAYPLFGRGSHFTAMAVLVAALVLGGCAGPRSHKGYKYKPYTIRGVTYYPLHPKQARGFVETGTASHYKEGGWFFPGKTSLGERFRGGAREGAHKTLPIPCRVRVTNLRNGRKTTIRINDRGPFIAGRIIDVTPRVAKDLGFYRSGLAPVRIEVLSVGDGKYRIR